MAQNRCACVCHQVVKNSTTPTRAIRRSHMCLCMRCTSSQETRGFVQSCSDVERHICGYVGGKTYSTAECNQGRHLRRSDGAIVCPSRLICDGCLMELLGGRTAAQTHSALVEVATHKARVNTTHLQSTSCTCCHTHDIWCLCRLLLRQSLRRSLVQALSGCQNFQPHLPVWAQSGQLQLNTERDLRGRPTPRDTPWILSWLHEALPRSPGSLGLLH